MLKTKVKISKVSNLTDARYFAAMGVDFLGFCCNIGTEKYCSISKIKEIIDWVEGPEFVLEFEGYQKYEDIQMLLASELASHIHIGAFAGYDKKFDVPMFKDMIFENTSLEDLSDFDIPVIRTDRKFSQLTSTEIDRLKLLLAFKPAYLDLDLIPDEIQDILDQLPLAGLILRGGDEEKVGFKSFDQMDAIFDQLMD